MRKRITAAIACANTVFIGLIAGIYVSGDDVLALAERLADSLYCQAGEVPRMQYQIADTSHKVILGNVLFVSSRPTRPHVLTDAGSLPVSVSRHSSSGLFRCCTAASRTRSWPSH